MDSFLAEVGVNPPESIEEFNRLFAAWLSECYHSKTHSALGMTPEHAFQSDSMPLRYPDEAILASAFLHCETRKVNKSGAASASWARSMTWGFCMQDSRSMWSMVRRTMIFKLSLFKKYGKNEAPYSIPRFST